MLAGIRCTGTIHARAQSQVLMNNLKISHGKSISSVKQLVQDMDPERMKDLSVETLIDQARISGTATGWILVVWKLQEMLVGTQSSGMIHVRAQNQASMKFIRPSPGKTTLNAKQSVQGMVQKRMKDLSVPTSIDQNKIFGNVIGKTLDV